VWRKGKNTGMSGRGGNPLAGDSPRDQSGLGRGIKEGRGFLGDGPDATGGGRKGEPPRRKRLPATKKKERKVLSLPPTAGRKRREEST